MPNNEKCYRKILFIGRSAWSEHGGIQRFNRRIALALQEISHFSEVMMLDDRSSDVPESETSRGYTSFSGNFFKFLLKFIYECRNSKILLLGHINFLPLAIFYKILSPFGKVVLFAHGVEVWGDDRYRPARFYEPFFLKITVKSIAIVSRYSQKVMAEVFHLSEKKFVLFPNAIDIPENIVTRKKDGKTVLVVSRLAVTEVEKNVDKIISSLPNLRKIVPDANINVVGDGTLRPILEKLALDLGVFDYVRFSGFVNEAELAEAYREASIFALPSSKEGFGIVYLEAWAKGLPVIASRYGAAPEVVSDGIDGYTVDPDDPEQILKSLSTLLLDDDLSLRFSTAGLKKIQDLYSDKSFRIRLMEICRS